METKTKFTIDLKIGDVGWFVILDDEITARTVYSAIEAALKLTPEDSTGLWLDRYDQDENDDG